METIWFGFLFGIGLMLAVAVVALAPHLIRLAFFAGAVVVALAVGGLCLVLLWQLWLEPVYVLLLAVVPGIALRLPRF